MSDEAPSLLVPLVIAAMGLMPLALMASGATTSTPETTLAPEPATTAITIEEETTTPSTIVVTTPVYDVAGVSDPIDLVLAAHGFTGQETVAGIPDSVVALLRSKDVVLTIAVEEGEG